MSLLDAIIVGSGPGGTFCAKALSGMNVLVLDVGHDPPDVPEIRESQFELRRNHADLSELMIGENYESLHNLHSRNISLKLKSPHFGYVTRDAERLLPVAESNFETTLSFARGGLANAWGAGVFRFDDDELRDYPLNASDLDSYYDQVTDEIGICGQADDLVRYFGSTEGLQAPLQISALATSVLRGYERNRTYFNRRGIRIGMPRLAILSEPFRGRHAYRYQNLEFFRPHDPAIYNPAYTLGELVDSGQIRYLRRRLVVRYSETESDVEVTAVDLDTDNAETYRARALFLAAGAISTAKLVLHSSLDHSTKLPILDNPMTLVPFVKPNRIGAPFDKRDSSFGQLNIVIEDSESGDRLQAGVHGATGPLRTDVLFNFPLGVSDSLSVVRYLAPALFTVMLFYPDCADERNSLRLRESGVLEITCARPRRRGAEARLIPAFRKLGLFGARALCQYSTMGSGLHYAGTLPMKAKPGPYQTDSNGLLFGTRRIYIADGACLTSLPAKNLTMTIMANALRIATRFREQCI